MLLLTKAIGILLTPPGVLIVLGVVGLLLQLRWRYVGLSMLSFSILLLLTLSLPVTGAYLVETLESQTQPIAADAATLRERVGAIVVLGGGRHTAAPEYGGDTVSEATLERLRYGARLHRLTGLPLLVAGGAPFGETISEGELMQQSLIEDFQVRAEWVEGRSRTTYENAVYTRAILEANGVSRVALVTHAWHMPRALWTFREAGIDALPAPTAYSTTRVLTPLAFLPSIAGLVQSSRVAHEWTGLLWYRLSHVGAENTR